MADIALERSVLRRCDIDALSALGMLNKTLIKMCRGKFFIKRLKLLRNVMYRENFGFFDELAEPI